MDELRQARVAAGMTQRQVAEVSGVAVSNISAYERGVRPISPKMRERIAKATRRPSQALWGHRDAVLVIMRQFGARNVRVFGSVARGTDSPESDIDLLFDPPERMTIYRLVTVQNQLASLLGFPVDLVSATAVRGHMRAIVEEAVPL